MAREPVWSRLRNLASLFEMAGGPYAQRLPDERDRTADRQRPWRRERQVQHRHGAGESQRHAHPRQAFDEPLYWFFALRFSLLTHATAIASRQDRAPREAKCRAG